MSNLTIWDAVRAVPQNATKPIEGGRLKGKTDINPMWRIKALTEQFGPCGIGWKYVVTNKWTEKGYSDEVAAFVDIDLYVKSEGEWSEAIPGTGGSMLVAKERNGPYTSDECFKMALTDAISVACKALGFGADIYWEADRSKYSQPKQGTKPGQNPEKVPDQYTHRGAQTPTYNPPPMPAVKPAKPTDSTPSKKVKELMNLADSLYGRERAIECIREYLTLAGYEHTSKIPEEKLKDFENFIDMFETHLPEDL